MARTTDRRGQMLRNWLMENGYQWSIKGGSDHPTWR